MPEKNLNKQELSDFTVGWIGAGRMGYAMARRLLHAGADVAVYNRTRAKAETLRRRWSSTAQVCPRKAQWPFARPWARWQERFSSRLMLAIPIAILLQEQAKNSGLDIQPESVEVADGLHQK